MVTRPNPNHTSAAHMAVFFVLFAIAIPWYWRCAGFPPDARLHGLPTWFVVSVLASLAISCFAAWQLRRPWPDERPTEEEREP